MAVSATGGIGVAAGWLHNNHGVRHEGGFGAGGEDRNRWHTTSEGPSHKPNRAKSRPSKVGAVSVIDVEATSCKSGAIARRNFALSRTAGRPRFAARDISCDRSGIWKSGGAPNPSSTSLRFSAPDWLNRLIHHRCASATGRSNHLADCQRVADASNIRPGHDDALPACN